MSEENSRNQAALCIKEGLKVFSQEVRGREFDFSFFQKMYFGKSFSSMRLDAKINMTNCERIFEQECEKQDFDVTIRHGNLLHSEVVFSDGNDMKDVAKNHSQLIKNLFKKESSR